MKNLLVSSMSFRDEGTSNNSNNSDYSENSEYSDL